MTYPHLRPQGRTGADLPPPPIGVLVVGTVNLLQEAADLPQPRAINVYDEQHISLHFDADPASLRAITRWALRFGGVLISEPHHDETGMATYCHRAQLLRRRRHRLRGHPGRTG